MSENGGGKIGIGVKNLSVPTKAANVVCLFEDGCSNIFGLVTL